MPQTDSNSENTSHEAPLDAYDQSSQNCCELCGRTNTLDVLYAFPGNKPIQVRRSIIPEQYTVLCSDCFEDASEHTPEDLTDEQLMAGIISDSLGYATPAHAARHIEDYQNNEEHCHCERGHAHFDNSLDALMEAARIRWITRSASKQNELLELVSDWKSIEEEDKAASMGISMQYPVQNAADAIKDSEDNTDDLPGISITSNTTLSNHIGAICLNRSNYRFFEITDVSEGIVKHRYFDNTFGKSTRVEEFKSEHSNQTRIISPNTIQSTLYNGCSLEPSDEDIDALRRTLVRSDNTPTEYTRLLIKLENENGLFNE